MSEKEEIIARLRRIEGQVRGLSRMVDEEKACEDILTQLLAARSALDQAGLQLISHYLGHCLPDQVEASDVPMVRHHLQRVLELMLRMH